jgi:hypothetical protein
MKINEKTEIKLDLKTIVTVIVVTASFVGMYFTLKTDIELAKTLPPTDIQRLEYDLKNKHVQDRIQDIEMAMEAMFEYCREHELELHKLDENYNSHVDSKIRNLEKRIHANAAKSRKKKAK